MVAPSFPSSYTDSGHSEGETSWQARKSQSLPKKLPTNDPILLALKKYQDAPDGRGASPLADPGTPASPDSLFSPADTLSPESERTESPFQDESYRSPFFEEVQPHPISAALRAGRGAQVSPEESQLPHQGREGRGGPDPSCGRW